MNPTTISCWCGIAHSAVYIVKFCANSVYRVCSCCFQSSAKSYRKWWQGCRAAQPNRPGASVLLSSAAMARPTGIGHHLGNDRHYRMLEQYHSMHALWHFSSASSVGVAFASARTARLTPDMRWALLSGTCHKVSLTCQHAAAYKLPLIISETRPAASLVTQQCSACYPGAERTLWQHSRQLLQPPLSRQYLKSASTSESELGTNKPVIEFEAVAGPHCH
jgi:hypothetical protein